MKKFVAIMVALCMIVLGSVTASAAPAARASDERLVTLSAQAYAREHGINAYVVYSQVEEVDEFRVCKMLIMDASTRAAGEKTGHAVHAWFDSYDNYIGTIEVSANFTYSSSGTTMNWGEYWSSSMDSNASYDVTGEHWDDSGTFTKAYYKISYRFYYGTKSKTATLEVNCSNSGVLGDNGDEKFI